MSHAYSVKQSGEICKALNELQIRKVLSDVYLEHLETIVHSVFMLGYKGKVVNTEFFREKHRTTISHFLNNGKWNRLQFEKALKDKSFGYVSEIIENTKKMLRSTIEGKTEVVEKILHDIHNSEIAILQYNDENSLSCVITLAYLSARDTYRVECEEKSGKGYADFTFHPRRNIKKL